MRGHPPKVIWIRRGNCSTDEVAAILRDHQAEMLVFEGDTEGSFLALG
jgi:predicted nuclease of predicted toxin-antitoxin system